MLQKVNAAHFCDVFFRYRAVFPSRNKKIVLEIKNPAPLGSTRIKYLTFIKYFRHLHILVKAGARTQTDEERHNSKITNRQTFHRFVCNMFIYGQFWSKTFFWKSQKKKSTLVYYRSKLKLFLNTQFVKVSNM